MNNHLSLKERKIRQLMLSCFVPALNMYLNQKNPGEYAKWQGNCCRQTAILGAMVLRECLPEYEWSAWDGQFKDVLQGHPVEYNHAWAYGVNKRGGHNLLADMSRTHKEKLFIPVTSNSYPEGHPDYQQMVEIGREEIPLEDAMMGTEYYTGLPSRQVLSEVTRLMSLVYR